MEIETLAINGILAFIAGVILNFTPCVLPVMPFKIQAVLREVSGSLLFRALAAAALLGGSLSFFIPLGIATAYFGVLWGEVFQSKVFLGFLSIFLFLSALAMFFDWTLRIPQRFYQISFHRYLGAYFTGMLAGVLSTPCTGPFLGGVLGYTITQSPQVTLTIFTLIAVGLACPYVLILLYPGVLARLPCAGRFALDLKQFLGFILLAGSIFFAQVLLPTTTIPIIAWSTLVVFLGWTVVRFLRSVTWRDRAFPFIAFFIVISVVLRFQFQQTSASALAWNEIKNGDKEFLQSSLSKGRPVFIEFTADWCLNCKVMEKTVYADSKVEAVFFENKMTPIRFDMTEFTEAQKNVLLSYGGVALPHAVLIGRDGKIKQSFSGMFSAQSLIDAVTVVNSKLPHNDSQNKRTLRPNGQSSSSR